MILDLVAFVKDEIGPTSCLEPTIICDECFVGGETKIEMCVVANLIFDPIALRATAVKTENFEGRKPAGSFLEI